jgi:uncharacterized membrane protein
MNSLLDFFRRFFISPIWERTGYNWVNTLIYGILLGLAAVITYKLVRRTGYRFNLDLFMMFLPYLIFATAVRALVDSGRYPYTYLLISPGIYFTTMGIFAAGVLAGLAVRRLFGREVKTIVVAIGAILAISQIGLLVTMIKRPVGAILITAVSLGVCGALQLVRMCWAKRLTFLRSRENVLILWFHLIDATVTFLGVDFYGYAEQHVLPQTLISILGSASVMYLLKLTVLPIVLYLLDRYVEEEEMNLFMKMIIMALGLAPATRNYLRIIIGS